MAINANRFIAPVINPSLLTPPNAIDALDVETILAERMEEFGVLAEGYGFPYDVQGLETDPIKIDQEVHAYRELLMRARVNSGIRAVLPAYAQGSDLDAIAARANVARLEIAPADPMTGTAAVMEDDASLLLRYLTSFAVPSAGSADAYIYWSVMAWTQVRDVAVLGPEVHGVNGKAAIYLLAEAGAPVTTENIEAVRASVTKTNVKPLTDIVTVGPANVIPYTTELRITLPAGPAPEVVRKAVLQSVQAVTDARFAIGAKVWVNALEGAAYVANVLRVERIAPLADIVPGSKEAAYCEKIVIHAEIETS
jgi:phage-related baseplate assembly protein